MRVSSTVSIDLYFFLVFHNDSNNTSFEREQSLDYFDIVKDLSFLTNYIHLCVCFPYLSVICVFLSFFHFLLSHYYTFVSVLSRSKKHWYGPWFFLFLLCNNISIAYFVIRDTSSLDGNFLCTRLAPSDYHLFRSLHHHLCNKHYEDFDELKSDLTAFFELQSASFYKRGIELLPARWAKVVENNGDYIVDRCCISTCPRNGPPWRAKLNHKTEQNEHSHLVEHSRSLTNMYFLSK